MNAHTVDSQRKDVQKPMVSDGYKELLRVLAIPTVSLGYITIRIYDLDELEEGQMGYSVDPSGMSLIDEKPGSWQRKWVVIGYEDECADPIFIDTAADGFPVYTAMHGAGTWEPNLIATGLRNFATAMCEIARVAEGRENPVKLEANRIEDHERTNVLNGIERDNPGIDITVWENWLFVG